MRVRVLGSAAGGGFPQWNCACPNCSRLRAGDPHLRARTQAQLVVCLDANDCYLVNASPDLRTQILSTSLLAPSRPPRHTPVSGIFLTSADVDSVAGLLSLREFQPLHIFATASVRRIVVDENRIFRVLERASPPVSWQDVAVNRWLPVEAAASRIEPPVRFRLVPVGNAFPDYVSEGLRGSLPPQEAVVGLLLAQGNKQIFYAPALPAGASDWKQWAQSSDICLVDGTFWNDRELISAGVGSKTAREIGHVPLSGPGGLLQEFDAAKPRRKILIHINNTNPVLDEGSPEHREVRDAGWEIAYDGMEIDL
jgi:pyrroloquinoline quinone biosynthesis protein B